VIQNNDKLKITTLSTCNLKPLKQFRNI